MHPQSFRNTFKKVCLSYHTQEHLVNRLLVSLSLFVKKADDHVRLSPEDTAPSRSPYTPIHLTVLSFACSFVALHQVCPRHPRSCSKCACPLSSASLRESGTRWPCPCHMAIYAGILCRPLRAGGMTREWLLEDNITPAETVVEMMFQSMPEALRKIFF